MHREDVAFRIVEDPLPLRGGGRYVSYFDVEDVDALWSELKPNLDLPPAGHVQRPCDQPYGQREFAVTGPDDDLIGVGGPIPARPCYFGVKPGGRRPL